MEKIEFLDKRKLGMNEDFSLLKDQNEALD